MRFYSSINNITKISNLPWGIYNLSTKDMKKFTDLPKDYEISRSMIITTGTTTFDEKATLILGSHFSNGGIYYGFIYGTEYTEYTWIKC